MTARRRPPPLLLVKTLAVTFATAARAARRRLRRRHRERARSGSPVGHDQPRIEPAHFRGHRSQAPARAERTGRRAGGKPEAEGGRGHLRGRVQDEQRRRRPRAVADDDSPAAREGGRRESNPMPSCSPTCAIVRSQPPAGSPIAGRATGRSAIAGRRGPRSRRRHRRAWAGRVFRVVSVPFELDDVPIGTLYLATGLDQRYAEDLGSAGQRADRDPERRPARCQHAAAGSRRRNSKRPWRRRIRPTASSRSTASRTRSAGWSTSAAPASTRSRRSTSRRVRQRATAHAAPADDRRRAPRCSRWPRASGSLA